MAREEESLYERVKKGPVLLFHHVDGPRIGEIAPEPESYPPLPCLFTSDGEMLFGEKLVKGKRLVIFGCGHVGEAVYKLARFADFPVTMVDDREALAPSGKFPEAELYAESFRDFFAHYEFTDDDCLVIVTRGHSGDAYCLEEALGRKSAYIGMMGSAGKVAAVKASLREKGIPSSLLDRVHAPIGLDIGANTPSEIAISIIAEIMQATGKKKHVESCPLTVFRAIAEAGEEGVEIITIARSGSAPRSLSSRMFVTRNHQVGSIGGGAIEAEATRRARALLEEETKACRERYSLSAAAGLGMACGGEVTLLFVKHEGNREQ